MGEYLPPLPHYTPPTMESFLSFSKSFRYDPVNMLMFLPPTTTYDPSVLEYYWIPRPKRTLQPLPFTLHKPPSNNSPYLIIYSHGNAMDLGDANFFAHELASSSGYSVLSYDYTGYGQARQTGQIPCEASATNDVAAVYDFVRTELQWPSERIILLGQSIGSGIATFGAAYAQKKKENIGGLFLASGYTSIRRVAAAMVGFPGNLILNRFNNQRVLTTLDCPLLLVHGNQDEVIPYHMSTTLAKEYKGHTVSLFHTAEGRGHNNMSVANDLSAPLHQFISQIEQSHAQNGTQIPPIPKEIDLTPFCVHPWDQEDHH